MVLFFFFSLDQKVPQIMCWPNSALVRLVYCPSSYLYVRSRKLGPSVFLANILSTELSLELRSIISLCWSVYWLLFAEICGSDPAGVVKEFHSLNGRGRSHFCSNIHLKKKQDTAQV